jgi:hypothetical protein
MSLESQEELVLKYRQMVSRERDRERERERERGGGERERG